MVRLCDTVMIWNVTCVLACLAGCPFLYSQLVATEVGAVAKFRIKRATIETSGFGRVQGYKDLKASDHDQCDCMFHAIHKGNCATMMGSRGL